MKYIDKIYGEFELSGVIEELINTNIFQRLKNIHQGGAIFLFNPKINQTRFDHSIGVMLLIKKLGGSIKEQIAGLIHDISHTAFSHLIDYVLEFDEEDYHEKRFKDVLENEDLIAVLRKYGFEKSQFLEIEQYKILDYPLPNLCADRIDYTLRDLYQVKALSRDEIDWFLAGLQIFDDRIVLKSTEYGYWFQEKYNYLITDYFGAKENIAANLIMTKIVKECLAKKLIEERDFHRDDIYVLEKIKEKINLSKRINELKDEGLNLGGLKMKERKVNPEILVNNRVIKLSDTA